MDFVTTLIFLIITYDHIEQLMNHIENDTKQLALSYRACIAERTTKPHVNSVFIYIFYHSHYIYSAEETAQIYALPLEV